MTHPSRHVTAAIALTLVATFLGGCDEEPAPTLTGLGAAMDTYLTNLPGGHSFQGAVLVARGSDVLFSKGYGLADQTTGRPNTPDTLYRIGWVTKQFTALAVLKLQELGELKVTDRVCRHVTPCPAQWRAVTVEHLLVHSSGIPDYLQLPIFRTLRLTTLSPLELVDMFRDEPLRFAPGSRWEYSLSGYALLGYVIERLTGLTYADFLRQRILDPLGLAATGYDVNEPTAEAHAVGYTGGSSRALSDDMSVLYAAGALYSSVNDLARWNRFLLTGTPAIVEPDIVAQLLTPRFPLGAASGWHSSYGGFALGPTTNPTYSHGGNYGGYAASSAVKPRDQVSVVVLSNNQGLSAYAIAERLITIASP
jgi:CubicO group peptidase (beta-lactamase class C family)